MHPNFGFKMRKVSFQSVGSIWNTERMKMIIPNEQIRQVSFKRKECRPSLLMSIVPLFFATPLINIYRLFFQEVTICFLVFLEIIFKCFSICFGKEFSKKL